MDKLNWCIQQKKERIDVQYYLKEPKEIDTIKVKEFINNCKIIINKLSEDEINQIKEKITQIPYPNQ